MPPDETVIADAPKESPQPATFREHYEAAKAQSQDQAPEPAKEDAAPASDDTKTETKEPPAEDTAKAADQPGETAESKDELLPPEEVAKLSAKERTAYEKSQASYTRKTQALATARKEFEPWKPLIDGLQTKPDETLEQLATARGFKLVKQDAATEATAKVTVTELDQALAELPEDVRPLFEAFGKRLLNAAKDEFKKEIEPIKETHRQTEIENIKARTDSVLEAFTGKHPGWEKHEARMLEIAKDFQASKTADEFKYMEALLKLATDDISEAEKTKKVVDKINKAAAKAEEPVTPTSDKFVVHALPAPEKRGLREAYEAAKRGEQWAK